ncbi:MAG: fibronectin type III domain-containing protein [Candidatus Bipolaricaulota bacterium]
MGRSKFNWVLLVSLLCGFILFANFLTIGQEHNGRYRYYTGCPESNGYCPVRYESLSTDKRVYEKGETVTLKLSNLESFAYLIEEVEIYYKKTAGGDPRVIYIEERLGEIPATASSWEWEWDQTLSDGEQAPEGYYYIRLKTNCCGYYRTYFRIQKDGGGFQLPADSSEEEAPTAPDRPDNFNLSSTSPNQIELSWDSVSGPVEGFLIYRNGRELDTVSPNTTSYVDRDLEGESEYCYQVAAFNEEGESELSSESCGETFKLIKTETTPSTPSELSAEASGPEEIELTWTDNSDNEEGFRIYRNGSELDTVGSNTTRYVDDTVRPDTDYSYKVAAFNSAGESSTSSSSRITTPENTPTRPGNLSLRDRGPEEIELTWTDNSDNEEGFRIYRNGSELDTVGSNTTRYVDDTVRPDTDYSYKVAAFNSAGESSTSSSSRITTPEIEEPEEETLPAEPLSATPQQLWTGVGMVLMIIGYTYLQVS